ncbi:MAG: hypothetical protein HY002_19690 [Candidatus Rokubacteria bacterium]|nr:hypothetical protein [Candidatus Rokubacteria bacterium]
MDETPRCVKVAIRRTSVTRSRVPPSPTEAKRRSSIASKGRYWGSWKLGENHSTVVRMNSRVETTSRGKKTARGPNGFSRDAAAVSAVTSRSAPTGRQLGRSGPRSRSSVAPTVTIPRTPSPVMNPACRFAHGTMRSGSHARRRRRPSQPSRRR